MREVFRYFVRHPQAVDDLEGIARWRLAGEVIRHTVGETYRAVWWLVKHDYLRATPTIGPARVFSLNPDKVREASARLALDAPPATADDDRAEG